MNKSLEKITYYSGLTMLCAPSLTFAGIWLMDWGFKSNLYNQIINNCSNNVQGYEYGTEAFYASTIAGFVMTYLTHKKV